MCSTLANTSYTRNAVGLACLGVASNCSATLSSMWIATSRSLPLSLGLLFQARWSIFGGIHISR